MTETLEEVLNDEGSVETEATTEVKAETESTGEEAAETTSSPEVKAEVKEEDPDPVQGFKDGYIAERQRRQEAEARLEQYERQQRQNQQKEAFWDNPEGALSGIQQDFQTQLQRTRTDLSVEMMKSIHKDYDEMEAKFCEAANNNPALISEMSQSVNPARFAYEYGKRKTEMEAMQDPGYRDKLKAEVRAEIEAEMKEKLETDIQQSKLPGTLSNARAAGDNNRSVVNESLGEILGR